MATDNTNTNVERPEQVTSSTSNENNPGCMLFVVLLHLLQILTVSSELPEAIRVL